MVDCKYPVTYYQDIYLHTVRKLWQYRLSSFQERDTKLHMQTFGQKTTYHRTLEIDYLYRTQKEIIVLLEQTNCAKQSCSVSKQTLDLTVTRGTLALVQQSIIILALLNKLQDQSVPLVTVRSIFFLTDKTALVWMTALDRKTT